MNRRLLCIVTGAMLVLLLSGFALAQEVQSLRTPDSIHVIRNPYFYPSLSLPYFQPYGRQLSLGDQAIIGGPELLSTYYTYWKRSFLLGASFYKMNSYQLYQPAPGKETFFQKFQMVLGVAELAGAAYLGYKAIKEEPITKKKK